MKGELSILVPSIEFVSHTLRFLYWTFDPFGIYIFPRPLHRFFLTSSLAPTMITTFLMSQFYASMFKSMTKFQSLPVFLKSRGARAGLTIFATFVCLVEVVFNALYFFMWVPEFVIALIYLLVQLVCGTLYAVWGGHAIFYATRVGTSNDIEALKPIMRYMSLVGVFMLIFAVSCILAATPIYHIAYVYVVVWNFLNFAVCGQSYFKLQSFFRGGVIRERWHRQG